MTTETLKRTARKATVAEYRRHDTDSGSPEVQIALLTQRINHINEHMKINRKDFGAQRGLLKLVGKRNRLLRYIKRTNEEGYRTLIGSLGLRK